MSFDVLGCFRGSKQSHDFMRVIWTFYLKTIFYASEVENSAENLTVALIANSVHSSGDFKIFIRISYITHLESFRL
jgi:hypothetical protein